MRHLLPVLVCALALVALALPAQAKPEDAQVGHVRAVFRKGGTALKPQPRAFGGQPVATLPAGARVRIVEKRGTWFRVQPLSGGGAAGWVPAAQTIAPYALSSDARFGNTSRQAPTTRTAQGAPSRAAQRLARSPLSRPGRRSTGSFSAAERSAAGRGLLESMQGRATSQQMRRGYAMLGRITRPKPSASAVGHFAKSGGLSRP